MWRRGAQQDGIIDFDWRRRDDVAEASIDLARDTRASDGGCRADPIPFLKRFTVFNADQCENLPAALTTAPAPIPEGLILPEAEALIAATGADSGSAASTPSTTPATISSRFLGRTPISSRSTGTGQPYTNSVTGAATRPGSAATCQAVSALRCTPRKN